MQQARTHSFSGRGPERRIEGAENDRARTREATPQRTQNRRSVRTTSTSVRYGAPATGVLVIFGVRVMARLAVMGAASPVARPPYRWSPAGSIAAGANLPPNDTPYNHPRLWR